MHVNYIILKYVPYLIEFNCFILTLSYEAIAVITSFLTN